MKNLLKVWFCVVAFAVFSSNAAFVNTAVDSMGVAEYGQTLPIAYNPEFCGASDTADAVSVVSINGNVVGEFSGSGVYQWTPSSVGEYTVSLKVLVAGVQVGSELSRSLRVQKNGKCFGIGQPQESMTATSGVTVVDARADDDLILARSTESIAYSSLWAGDATSMATVCVNDEVIKSASGVGDVLWSPPYGGEYVFTHTTTKNGVQVGKTLTAKFWVESKLAMNDLKVTQIAPWGLAIDFDIEGAIANYVLDVRSITSDGAVTNVAKTLLGDVGCSNGAHRVYWNTAKDEISIEKERATIMVGYRPPRYCIIDLSGGTNATSFAVSYCDTPPEGGFNVAAYKTTNLVLRCCSAGAEPLGRYSLTKDFYAGLFEVTQKQWELVMGTKGTNETKLKGVGETYPAYFVASYNDIRGSTLGANWPASSEVDAASFMGVLRAKTGLTELDLPTEAQWEYTCRAGTTTVYYTGDDEAALATAGWYWSNSDSTTHPVGEKTANAWGFYDMHGNVWEWCLDWEGCELSGSDPIGAATGTNRILRGGGWGTGYEYATCSGRTYVCTPDDYGIYGFRVFMTVK